jgi:outer membrane immunogenic protein
MKKLVLAIFAIPMGSVGAFAADMPVKAPIYKAAVAPAVGYNWSGFYIGLNAGYGNARTSADSPDGTIADSFLVGFSDNYGGFTGGFQAGYNVQFAPNWVVGVEGDIGYLRLRRQALDMIVPGLQTTTQTDGYGTLRARFGYAWDRSLVYATGGAAFLRIKDSIDCCRFPLDFDHNETTVNRTGWTVGGGFETALAANWTAKLEYLYIDAGSVDVVNTDEAPDNDTMRFRHQFHIVKFGLNYRLGDSPIVARY